MMLPTRLIIRRILLVSLPILITTASLFYITPAGARLTQVQALRRWIESEPAAAPAIFIVAYCAAALLALPVWWLQIIAGACFGLFMGMLWCHIASLLSVTITLRLAHWLVGDWMRQRVEPYHRRLGRISAALGHNGLMVVAAARASTVMPFGITNYLLGLTRIQLAEALVGTLLGTTLMMMIHVGIGADPRLLGEPRFVAATVVINVLLLSPLLLRYVRPDWFRRLGLR